MPNSAVPAVLNASPSTVGARSYDGVLTRRLLAFMLDAIIIGLLTLMVAILILLAAFASLGIAFIFWPLLPFVGVLYSALSVSGPAQATLGMQAMGLIVTDQNGKRLDFIMAAGHAMVFWVLSSVLTPMIALIGLFNREKRLLQDFLTGVLVSRRFPR